jgi:hypothetical protein
LKKRRRPPGGKQKTFDHFGFGLSGQARPSFVKVFWFFLSQRNGFQPLAFAWRFNVPPTWAVTRKDGLFFGPACSEPRTGRALI